MSALRNGGTCYRCGKYLPAGAEVGWTKDASGKNRFHHPGDLCPQGDNPSNSPPPSPSPPASIPSPPPPEEPVSVSVERCIVGEHGHVLVRFQGRGSDVTKLFNGLRERADRLIGDWASEELPEEMSKDALPTRPPGKSPRTPKPPAKLPEAP